MKIRPTFTLRMLLFVVFIAAIWLSRCPDQTPYVDPLHEDQFDLAKMPIQHPVSRSIDRLPPHVAAPDGRLTLYADFDDVRDGFVTVYLVNRIGMNLDVPATDGDIYIKLETRLRFSKEWLRAQSHIDSTCGLSRHSISVPANQYIEVRGWMPEEGVEREVRYRLYNTINLASNSGLGLVHAEEFSRAQRDHMAIRSGDTALIKRVIDSPQPARYSSARMLAIQRLRHLPRNESLPLLERLIEGPDTNAVERDLANRVARRLRTDPF